MSEESKSALYRLDPLIRRWPAVTKPEGHVHFRRKLMWTAGILVVYFILSNVNLYGLSSNSIDLFSQFRAIIAGKSGSVIHLGIGPIVTGSIIMQLFVGAKIINLDLQDDEDKAIYQGSQKILVVAMIFIEAVPQVFGYLQPSSGLTATYGANVARLILIIQLSIGAYLIFLMDEVVSKWGIGSGISLFIAAGVSQALFTGLFNWLPAVPTTAISTHNPPGGVLPKTIYLLSTLSTSQLVNGGGFSQIFLQQPNPVTSLITTIITFLIVVYAQSTRIELPLAHGNVRGARGRYPIRLMYTNVIPVIFVSALLANVNLVSILLWNSHLPLVGHQAWVGAYQPGKTTPISGIAYYVYTVRGLQDWLLPFLGPQYAGPLLYRAPWQLFAHIIIFSTVLIVGSTIFAIFWAETANMGPDAVAKQIQSSGMQIPGFRRDPRIIEKVMQRYIPVVTVISGFAIGLIAASSDLLGVIGNVNGRTLLLAIGILSQTYQQMAQEQVMEMHPVLRGFFGEG